MIRRPPPEQWLKPEEDVTRPYKTILNTKPTKDVNETVKLEDTVKVGKA
jgi:hypothetical protein